MAAILQTIFYGIFNENIAIWTQISLSFFKRPIDNKSYWLG